jgi:hypothetical protein
LNLSYMTVPLPKWNIFQTESISPHQNIYAPYLIPNNDLQRGQSARHL